MTAGAKRMLHDVLARSDDQVARHNAAVLLAMVQQREGFLEDAEASFAEAVKIRSDSAWSHGNLAVVRLQRRKLDAAIESAERALAIMKFGVPYGVLAEAYGAKAEESWTADRRPEAEAWMKRLHELGEELPAVHSASRVQLKGLRRAGYRERAFDRRPFAGRRSGGRPCGLRAFGAGRVRELIDIHRTEVCRPRGSPQPG
ncbi:MAG TPA: tetratricopeptide repeat protein [Thermoanaerobaculia bacterium]|nr:tetratricopeptide repeat protein [Thermoanaerobaculia bacterium]